MGDWLYSFVLHVLTGFLAVGAHYSLMWLLVTAGMEGVSASGIGFLAGAATRFLLSYFTVFSPSHGVPVALRRFAFALAAQWLGNVVLLELLLLTGATLWLAQVGVTASLTFVNFLMYRLWVFRSRHPADSRLDPCPR